LNCYDNLLCKKAFLFTDLDYSRRLGPKPRPGLARFFANTIFFVVEIFLRFFPKDLKIYFSTNFTFPYPNLQKKLGIYDIFEKN
jgi:hypothetical protein